MDVGLAGGTHHRGWRQAWGGNKCRASWGQAITVISMVVIAKKVTNKWVKVWGGRVPSHQNVTVGETRNRSTTTPRPSTTTTAERRYNQAYKRTARVSSQKESPAKEVAAGDVCALRGRRR